MSDTAMLPPAGRYRVVTVSPPPERHQDRLGRHHVTFDGVTVQRRERRATGPVAASMEVLSVSRPTRGEWVLHGPDGAEWRLRGCGCGG